MRVIFFVAALAVLALPAAAQTPQSPGQVPQTVSAALPEIGMNAPDFTGTAADGSKVHLTDYKGNIVVLEWHNPGCPFVHKHYDSGSMQELQSDARGKGVVWLTINSGGPDKEDNMTPQQANDYVVQNRLTVTRYILDPSGTIGKLYGAKSTPHMFVIDAQGNLAYMGAIDDKPSADPASLTGATNYVRIAIDDLLANQPIAVTSTQSYGCGVKYAE